MENISYKGVNACESTIHSNQLEKLFIVEDASDETMQSKA